MATPTWNQITAPNFSAGNLLIVQAMDQLTKAGEGLQGVAKDYKDTLYKRNLGAIQEYVNSAKTPEELESEGFRTGLARLTGTMAGEYDTLAKAQVVDKAKDTLLSRKANQVSIASNEFNLDSAKQTKLTKEYTNKILAAPPEQRDALKQAAIDANAFDFGGVTAGDLGIAQLLGATQQNKLRDATWDDLVKAPGLANAKTEADIANDRRKLQLDAQRVENERLKALSEGGGKGGFSVVQGEEALDGIFKGIRANQSKALLDIRTKMPYNDMTEVDAEIRKTQTLEWWLPATAQKSKDIINNSPTLSKLPPNVKAAIYKGMVDRITANNIGGKMDWISQDDETYRKVALDAAKESIGYLLNANTMENALRQDGANKLMRMSNANGGKPVSFEEASAYLNKQLGSSPLNEYKVSNIILDGLEKEEAKRGEDKLRKAGSPVLPQGGFDLQLGGNMVVNQTQTGNSLQQTALPPNVNKLVSTPLDIVTNPSTIKTKPVADPLRQAALEQTPVATSNTAQPSQLTPAEVAQGETTEQAAKNTTALQEQEARMQNRARLSLEAQKALQNGQPFVVPAITAKLEETKPRELTPAEKQQAERMNQEALVGLAGTKLKEKQAEVQKQFPDTPLKQQAEPRTQAALSDLIGAKLEEKQALVRNAFPNASLTPINKATEPLGNNSEPLIQSMFKLPGATDNTSQPKSINKAATAEAKEVKQSVFPDTPLKQLAKAATPVPSPLIPVESQNAFRVKENNLALDFLTGKGTPTKEPVPMPKVTWKKPVQAVTINPIYAQLPQHKVVATFVPDGDTINATSDTYKTKGERAKKAGGIICRIDSIETPETAKPQYGKKGQPYGAEAAKILQQMVLNKEISIRVTKPTDGESNYGRDVCQIEVAGKDVSVELLRAGAAWLYKEYNHYGQGGLDLEATARESKSGLWGLGNPVYPPDFRHNGYQNP